MKMRYMTILYTVLVLAVAVLSFQKIEKISGDHIDMVEINESFKQIEMQLKEYTAIGKPEEKNGEDTNDENTSEMEQFVDSLESQYDCTIIFYTDDNYQSRLNASIKKSAIIIDYEENGTIIAKVCFDNNIVEFERQKKELQDIITVVAAVVWVIGMSLFFYIYSRYVIPFQKLKNFAGEVARGNLDMPLSVTKENYFGVFTESFDIMREELKKAKENEYQANISKKELVAELSHDIKTPIATIKAACEIMQIKEQDPAMLEKVHLIEKKATIVEQLIGNLFHATLEELEVLKVDPTEEASTCIEEMFLELKGYGNLQIENHIPECLLIMDKLRMNQVIDNIVNNAFKYAKTVVHISFLTKKEGIGIRIHDEGSGVPEEELAKITEKFYRGSNADGETGSGLGLYLAKLFMEKMHGQMELYNENGFVVELYLRKA